MPPSDAGAGGKAGPGPRPEPALQHRALAALFVALLSVAGFLGFNIEVRHSILIVVYALLAGVIALWLAVTAVRRARRGRSARPRGSVAAIVLAGVGIGLSVILLGAYALFGTQLSEYGRCLSDANTVATQQACSSQFYRALNHEIGVLGGPGHG
jgi:NADH:ubiquinone oxidoreductase subunit 6 (subunit J)